MRVSSRLTSAAGASAASAGRTGAWWAGTVFTGLGPGFATAATCREIRKVKLPYSLNIVSEAIAELALERREFEVPDGGLNDIEEQRRDVYALFEGDHGALKWEVGLRWENTNVHIVDHTVDPEDASGPLKAEYSRAFARAGRRVALVAPAQASGVEVAPHERLLAEMLPKGGHEGPVGGVLDQVAARGRGVSRHR